MKKIIWITFITALVLVNILAWAANYFGGVYIALPYRLVIVLAISFITLIFAGAWHLMNAAEKEPPSHTGQRK